MGRGVKRKLKVGCTFCRRDLALAMETACNSHAGVSAQIAGSEMVEDWKPPGEQRGGARKNRQHGTPELCDGPHEKKQLPLVKAYLGRIDNRVLLSKIKGKYGVFMQRTGAGLVTPSSVFGRQSSC